MTSSPFPSVLVRYVKADGKLHTVNLQNANVADGRTHSIILRLGGLQRQHAHMELYVDCRLVDSSEDLPPLVPLPRDADLVEVRHGQKAYTRLQVSGEKQDEIINVSDDDDECNNDRDPGVHFPSVRVQWNLSKWL